MNKSQSEQTHSTRTIATQMQQQQQQMQQRKQLRKIQSEMQLQEIRKTITRKRGIYILQRQPKQKQNKITHKHTTQSAVTSRINNKCRSKKEKRKIKVRN